MLKKISYIFSVALLLVVLLSATIERSSSGAPPSHTGAPEEKTCAAVGCHDDNAINSGTAKMDLNLEGLNGEIIAGQTYTIHFKISDAAVNRFGFQLLALTKSNSENAGQFSIMDPQRTQLVNNRYAFKDRSYVTYTFSGTDAVSTGYGEWIVKWTAPKNIEGPITFYYAGVSANDDMSDKGDKTYTGSLTLNTKAY